MPEPSLRGSVQSEAERIGEAMLNLAARLPDGFHDEAQMGMHQASMYVSYDAGDEVWEVEFTALTPGRNRIIQDRDLNTVLWRALTLDREAAPDV